jgi:predicted ATP-binding protein involved in virulence
MILNSLHLKNYRCFESLEVDFTQTSGLFVVVGGNGAGKTTLLSAACAALAPILTRLPLSKRPTSTGILPSDIHLESFDHAAPFAYLAATGCINASEPVAWDRIRYRDTTRATKQLAPTLRNDTKFLHQQIDAIIDAHNQRQHYTVPVFAYYSTNRAVDVPQYRLKPPAIPTTFRRLMALDNALERKTDFRRAVGWFDLLEQREFREVRDGVQTPEATYCLSAVRRAIESMIPGIALPRIDGSTGRFAVNTRDPLGTAIRMHLDQLSDGYQVMLGVVMDFALRLAVANPPQNEQDDPLQSRAILMIDEVDLHLHPLWQQRVIPDLRRTFPNTQLILTTHSPQVATTVPAKSLRILKDGVLHEAPAGTEGAEAERLLEDVFLVNPRPDLPMSRKLNRYLHLVDAKEWDSDEAIELRSELDAWSQGEEPMLVDADLRIDNFKWEAGQ